MTRSLEERFADHVLEQGLLMEGEAVLVALSGGLDSTVLLHLLRFAEGLPRFALHAAHFDHGMRPASESDALWVRGLCRAWGVPLVLEKGSVEPGNEEAARQARYAFLERTRSGLGCSSVLTAHHADDQVETVLFRILRGTGLRGLRGIAQRRSPGLVRPLLPFWRTELEAYARLTSIEARLDPSNRDPRFARNVIRHELLPRVEMSVAPGAKAALLRLTRLAQHVDDVFAVLLPGLLESVLEEQTPDRTTLSRDRLLEQEPEVVVELLRALLRRRGVYLDEAGTRVMLEFTSTGASGRVIHLAGGLTLAREFDCLVLRWKTTGQVPEPDRWEETARLVIPGRESGEGVLRVGGRTVKVGWGCGGPLRARWSAVFSTEDLRFPLVLRAPQAGDRMRYPFGRKKLSKVLSEARVPVSERRGTVVLADSTGEILWVPGVARASGAAPGSGSTFTVAVSYADDH